MSEAAGSVWIVGAGPGDPGLVTLRGLEVLEQAEVVLHDPRVHAAVLELCTCEDRRDVGAASASAVAEQLVDLARAGKRVVWLEGGDPFLSAVGSEEATLLARAGVPFEVVPGVSLPAAAAAYAGIPLVHPEQASGVAFVADSDELSPEAWKRAAVATDTLCVLGGVRRLDVIARALVAGGRAPETPAVVIERGARPAQRVISATLGSLAAEAKAAGARDPAVIVVGEVVRLREQLRWYDSRPLFGKRILVPRPLAQAKASAGAIRERAAEPVVFPVIELCDPPDPEPIERAARELGGYDWVLFTSANGVDRFFAALSRAGRDARAFSQAKIGVIGPKTAKSLERYGLSADLVAEEYVGEGLARAIREQGGARRVLIPRALVARDTLPAMLREEGAEVDVVAAYETRPVDAERARELVQRFEDGAIDVAIFTSSSTVSSLCSLLGERAAELLGRVTVGSIGPVTSKTAEKLGVRVDVTATEYTVAGLLDALERHFG